MFLESHWVPVPCNHVLCHENQTKGPFLNLQKITETSKTLNIKSNL